MTRVRIDPNLGIAVKEDQAMYPDMKLICLRGNAMLGGGLHKKATVAAEAARVVGETPTLTQVTILGHNQTGGIPPVAGQTLPKAKAREKARARTSRAARPRSDYAAKHILQGHSVLNASPGMRGV